MRSRLGDSKIGINVVGCIAYWIEPGLFLMEVIPRILVCRHSTGNEIVSTIGDVMSCSLAI